MSRYMIEIDRDQCIGDKLCCEDAPDTFDIDDEQIVVVTNPNGNSEEEILSAAKCCPFDVIVLYDTDTGEKVWPKNRREA